MLKEFKTDTAFVGSGLSKGLGTLFEIDQDLADLVERDARIAHLIYSRIPLAHWQKTTPEAEQAGFMFKRDPKPTRKKSRPRNEIIDHALYVRSALIADHGWTLPRANAVLRRFIVEGRNDHQKGGERIWGGLSTQYTPTENRWSTLSVAEVFATLLNRRLRWFLSRSNSLPPKA